MPQYKVLEPGFYDNKMYSPEGKRRIVHTDEKLKPVPSWLELLKPETAAEKKKRLATEKKLAESDAEKSEQDQIDIDNASFMGDGENTKVETL